MAVNVENLGTLERRLSMSVPGRTWTGKWMIASSRWCAT